MSLHRTYGRMGAGGDVDFRLPFIFSNELSNTSLLVEEVIPIRPQLGLLLNHIPQKRFTKGFRFWFAVKQILQKL